jgi:hypothetical protein
LRAGQSLRVRRDYDSPYRNATYLENDGRLIAYLAPPDALAVGPEIDAGSAVEARVREKTTAADGSQTLVLDLQLAQ